MNGTLVMTIYLVTYGLGQTTHLTLGLYLNGVLESNHTVDVSNSPAVADSIVGKAIDSLAGPIANFTKNTVGYQVGFEIPGILPTGTTVTLTAFSTSPIWIRTTGASSGNSYELSALGALPGVLPSTSEATEVPSLCIQGGGNEA
jgi:hypothetical protein